MSAATLRQAKAMGGVGSILVLLSFVPFVGFVFGLAGLVMVLLAVKRISEAVSDREIFRNVLMAVILQMVGSAISVFVVIGSFFAFVGSQVGMAPFGPSFDGFGGPGILGAGAVIAVLGSLLAGLIAMWIMLIIAARFLKKGYERIAVRTGTKTFRTVGRLYFYGALLVIVLIGVILAFVAVILQIKAFFSLQETLPLQSRPQALSISRPPEGPEPREDGPFLVFP
jgi:uncharacterized membrane protein